MQHQSQLGTDEVVWRLLLQQWDPQAGVVCKLLCCSQAMAALVHSDCVGRLHAEMISLKVMAGHNVWWLAPTQAQRWLKRNVMLLRSFAFWPNAADIYADDEPIAEALAALAAAAAAAAESGAAAGVGPAAALPAGAAALPLQCLVCGVPSRGRILFSLAALAPHLTSLTLCTAEGWRPVTGCDSALAALTSLRELTIGCPIRGISGYDTHVFDALAPALQHLTRLTRLDLAPPYDASFSAHSESNPAVRLWAQPAQPGTLRLLPTSLVELVALLDTETEADGPFVDLGHLTALTQLYLVHLGRGHVLPPSLHTLSLKAPSSWLPLVEQSLPNLHSLFLYCVDADVCEFPAASRLQTAGAQQLSRLAAVFLYADEPQAGHLAACLTALGALPHLCRLAVKAPWGIPAPAVAAIGSCCQQLADLSLVARVFDGPVVRELTVQLPRLTTLEGLRLVGLTTKEEQQLEMPSDSGSAAAQSEWQALFAAVAKLPPLRMVSFEEFSPGAAAASLSAATQLTQVWFKGGHLDDTTAAALAAAFKHPQGNGSREHVLVMH